MGQGTRVDRVEADIATKKDLIVLQQETGFFMQKADGVLSTNVHNYLAAEKIVLVECDGGTLSSLAPLVPEAKIGTCGEQLVEWQVKVVDEVEAVIGMKTKTEVDGYAVEMRFPCFVLACRRWRTFPRQGGHAARGLRQPLLQPCLARRTGP